MDRPNITTKYEVDHQKKLLNEPHRQFNLTPHGMEFYRINHDLQRWRARRIDYLQTRLDVKSLKMRRDFDRAR